MKIAEYNEMMAYLLRPAQKETQVASLMDEYLGDQKEYQRAVDEGFQGTYEEYLRMKSLERKELAIGGGVIEGEDLGTREGFNVIKEGGTNIKTSQGFQPGNPGNIQALKEFQIKQTKEKNKKVKKFVELVEKGDSTTDAKNKVIKLFGLTRKKGSGTPPWMTEGKNILIDKGVLEETERGSLEIIGETEDFSKDKNIKLLSKETTEPGIKKAVYKNLTTGETFIKYKPLLRSNTVTVSGAGFDTLKQAQQTVKDYNKANPIKTGQTLKLEDDLRTLFNNPKIKPLLETGIPDKKYIKIAQNAIKGLTESQAEDKLKQLAEAVKPDGVYNIEGIDKINQNKANNIYKFFKSKDISRKIEDKAIGQSVGEGSIATPRADIQEELPFEGGTKTYSVDEAKAIKGSYRLGSKPYSIFGQIIDGRINQGAKMGMDAKLSQFEEGVQKAIRGEGKLSVKEAIDKYNAAATKFENEINAYKSRGFRKITIPRISKEPPSKTIANKKAYKKYKKFFDKNFKELRYSFIIPKDLLPVPEIAAGMKDKKSPIYKRYFNDLKKAASEFIDNVNQYDEKELFEKIQKHPKFQKFRKIIPRLASLDMNLPDFSVFTPAMADEMAMFQTETPAAEEQNFIERNPKTTAAAGAVGSLGFKGVRKAVGKGLNLATGPTGVGALTYAFRPEGGYDLSRTSDRLGFEAEAALAPTLVKGVTDVSSKIKNPFLRKGLETLAGVRIPGIMNPANALRIAKIASPLGIASLGGEALYNYGKFAKDEIAKVKAMTPEERDFYNDLLMDEGGLLD